MRVLLARKEVMLRRREREGRAGCFDGGGRVRGRKAEVGGCG